MKDSKPRAVRRRDAEVTPAGSREAVGEHLAPVIPIHTTSLHGPVIALADFLRLVPLVGDADDPEPAA